MAEKNEAANQDEQKKEGGNKKLIIIIAAVVLVLLIGGGVAAFLLMSGSKTKEEPQDPGEKVPVPEISQKAEIGPMVNVDEFIVNIISEDTNHYVKASMTLELSSDEGKEEAVKRMPQIRDSILLLVGNKTYEELQDLQGKKQLKAELSSKINSYLQTGKVQSIFFTDFVVQ